MNDLTPEGAPGKAQRYLRPVLFISLALNLFLGGAIAAHFIAGPPSEPRFSGPAFKAVLDGMNEDDQEAYRDVRRMMRENFKEARPVIRELREARREAAAAIAADPYDEAATEAAFEKMRVLTDRLTANMQQGMTSAMAAAPLEVRRKFAEHLERGPAHRHGQRMLYRERRTGEEAGPGHEDLMDETPPPDMMP